MGSSSSDPRYVDVTYIGKKKGDEERKGFVTPVWIYQ